MKYKVVVNTCFGGFSLSEEAIKWFSDKYPQYDLESAYDWDYNNYPRHAKELVECIEALGPKASGKFSRLRVVEINTNAYYIEDNDGYESVIIPDNINWIIIE